MMKFLDQKPNNRYHLVAFFAMILALLIVMLGAYTRLIDAGLGCPDWPACYGKAVLPSAGDQIDLNQAQHLFPAQPLILKKAWTEMAHRYAASLLALLVLGLAFSSFKQRKRFSIHAIVISWVLVVIVILQALLGKWTVTFHLLPLVVTGHLMGGMCIVGLLCWLVNATHGYHFRNACRINVLKPWAIIGLLIITIQIFLGAWTSTNYSALACTDFPYCHGNLFPPIDWAHAFNFKNPIGPNYDGGQLDINARVTIQMVHRFGAFITTMYLVPFALCLLLIKDFTPLKNLGFILLLLLVGQICLGALNIVMLLPLQMAVAHNGIAALLLLTMVTLLYRIYASNPKRNHYYQ